MSKISDQEAAILDHVNRAFGYHGGIGDPPDHDAVLAVIRGTLEFVEREATPSPEE